MVMHVCANCGCPFTHKKSKRVYCSMDCRNATYRDRGASHPGTFRRGAVPSNLLPVGTERIRQRKHRTDAPRVWVKVAEPNVWEPRAVVRWRDAHGSIPAGHVVHHVNGDSLDDRLANLELLTRAAHAQHHAEEIAAARHGYA